MSRINKLIKILPIVLVFMMTSILETTEQSTLIQKTEKFVEHFNQRDYKSVHKMFSDEMKQALPLPQLEKVLSQFSRELGVITEKEFVRYER